jgi:hypothetical protein
LNPRHGGIGSGQHILHTRRHGFTPVFPRKLWGASPFLVRLRNWTSRKGSSVPECMARPEILADQDSGDEDEAAAEAASTGAEECIFSDSWQTALCVKVDDHGDYHHHHRYGPDMPDVTSIASFGPPRPRPAAVNSYANVCTITGPAIAVAGPASSGSVAPTRERQS